MGLTNWLLLNLNSLNFALYPCWKSLSAVVTCNLWKNRNCVIFQNSPLNNDGLLNKIMFELEYLLSYGRDTGAVHGCRLQPQDQINWQPPPEKQFKLNSDGSVFQSLGKASCGGLIRNHKGNFITGFYKSLHFCTPLEAELWGLVWGLKLAVSNHIHVLWIDCDCKDALHLVVNVQNSDHHLYSVIKEIRDLLRNIRFVRFNHVLRETNQCADWMAKLGDEVGLSFLLF
ncbi:uncharacterized protein LOC113849610 [Abrus precatorius]|uniref:Uncharacterized protein LOC113849610 n=1 Tax=Abrus precatorius TaxID=3816 RepID=A0A8B8JVR8_ABRPR|nr:uncharacterized protein LOC113849610 [Abrus precatorius]